MHSTISPAILYWGTPVVLVTSENPDSTSNISPISAAWWLGYSCILGFGANSQTPQNILRTKQCVLNLPCDSLVEHVNLLARTSGTQELPANKAAMGYEYVHDKWARAGLTPQSSDVVRPARIQQCPVQMECEMVASHEMMRDVPSLKGFFYAIELRILRVHVLDELRMEGHPNRIDTDKWRPMIMSFQQLYGLKDGKQGESTLARIDEENYRRATITDNATLSKSDE